MLNIAFASGWHPHAKDYLKHICSRPDVKLTVLWDEDPERGTELARQFSCAFEADYDAVLERPDVDAVCVNAPTAMHKEIIVKAAQAKKHVFTEKVLAHSNADAEAIRDAVVKSGIKFCISLPSRTTPAFRYAKQAAEEGLLGKVTLMRVRVGHDGVSSDWIAPYFLKKEGTGGGAMMDLGAHPMYLSNWIMGLPESVCSVFTKMYGHEVEDNAVSLLRYENGAIAVVEVSFVSKNCPSSIELYGTEGSLTALGFDTGVKVMTDKSGLSYSAVIQPKNLPAALPAPMDQWIDGILHGGKIHFGIDDAVGLTKLMDAAYRSYETGKEARV